MKTYILSGFLFISLFLTSCMKDDSPKDYYSTIGVINFTADSTIISTDYGSRLLVKNNDIESTIKNNDRIIAYFTKVDQIPPQGIDDIIELYSIDKVLLKPIIELTSNIVDSIGNDEIYVNALWVGKTFLNLDFSFYGGQAVHLINLVRQPGTIRTDTVNLEIKHNDKNDLGTTGLKGFVSFDLSSIENTITDSVVVVVKAKEYSNRTYSKTFTYKY